MNADYWTLPDDSLQKTYATREEALARAWEITPAGGQRPEPIPHFDGEEQEEVGRPLLIFPSASDSSTIYVRK
jgi:hypothetical protein